MGACSLTRCSAAIRRMKRGVSPLMLAVATSSIACNVVARACFDVAEGPPEPLMSPFLSFAAPEPVREALGHPPTWKIFSNAGRKGSWLAPRYIDTWVEVSGHQFRGHFGTLRLHFENDRLEDTRFYP